MGMLWFDDSSEIALDEKVRRAAQHYRTKYGREPNVCVVNPSTPGAKELEAVDGIELGLAVHVLPHHFYIGEDESQVF